MFERPDDLINAVAETSQPFRLSPVWDLYVPIAIAAIPAGLFTLLGFVTQGLDTPGAEVATWVVVVMLVLQTIGIITMAVVILMRFEFGSHELSKRANGCPSVWRRITLVSSIVFVLLFDIFINVGAAFAGAGFLLWLAVPAFIGYVFCVRVTFARL